MSLAIAIFVLTIALVIWQPRGLNIGWNASLGALLALLTRRRPTWRHRRLAHRLERHDYVYRHHYYQPYSG